MSLTIFAVTSFVYGVPLAEGDQQEVWIQAKRGDGQTALSPLAQAPNSVSHSVIMMCSRNYELKSHRI
jgi:hypothetical protein